jgi:hypothetical protein
LPRTSLLLAALMFATGTASAQRADTTAASEADDAFGLSVAGETIGLYSDKYVRGFSPGGGDVASRALADRPDIGYKAAAGGAVCGALRRNSLLLRDRHAASSRTVA